MPDAGSPAISLPFSSAIASLLPKADRWSVPTLVITPTVGRAMATWRSRDPAPVALISSTQKVSREVVASTARAAS